MSDSVVLADVVFVNIAGELWLDINVDAVSFVRLGPFDTAGERQRAYEDLLAMMRTRGAKDLPLLPQ